MNSFFLKKFWKSYLPPLPYSSSTDGEASFFSFKGMGANAPITPKKKRKRKGGEEKWQ